LPAVFTKEKILEFIDGKAPRFVSVQDIEELLSVLLVHLHAINFEHLNNLIKFKLARLIFVELLKDLYYFLVTGNL